MAAPPRAQDRARARRVLPGGGVSGEAATATATAGDGDEGGAGVRNDEVKKKKASPHDVCPRCIFLLTAPSGELKASGSAACPPTADSQEHANGRGQTIPVVQWAHSALRGALPLPSKRGAAPLSLDPALSCLTFTPPAANR